MCRAGDRDARNDRGAVLIGFQERAARLKGVANVANSTLKDDLPPTMPLDVDYNCVERKTMPMEERGS